jgi:hypothetical protein
MAVAGAVHLAHPAGAQEADDFVGAESRAWQQGSQAVGRVRPEQPGGVFDSVAFQERASGGMAVGFQKSRHLRTQLGIPGARGIQGGRAAALGKFPKLLKQFPGPVVIRWSH